MSGVSEGVRGHVSGVSESVLGHMSDMSDMSDQGSEHNHQNPRVEHNHRNPPGEHPGTDAGAQGVCMRGQNSFE